MHAAAAAAAAAAEAGHKHRGCCTSALSCLHQLCSAIDECTQPQTKKARRP